MLGSCAHIGRRLYSEAGAPSLGAEWRLANPGAYGLFETARSVGWYKRISSSCEMSGSQDERWLWQRTRWREDDSRRKGRDDTAMQETEVDDPKRRCGAVDPPPAGERSTLQRANRPGYYTDGCVGTGCTDAMCTLDGQTHPSAPYRGQDGHGRAAPWQTHLPAEQDGLGAAERGHG